MCWIAGFSGWVMIAGVGSLFAGAETSSGSPGPGILPGLLRECMTTSSASVQAPSFPPLQMAMIGPEAGSLVWIMDCGGKISFILSLGSKTLPFS